MTHRDEQSMRRRTKSTLPIIRFQLADAGPSWRRSDYLFGGPPPVSTTRPVLYNRVCCCLTSSLYVT